MVLNLEFIIIFSNALHSENMEFIVVTLYVQKLERSNCFKEQQPLNIPDTSVKFSDLIFRRFIFFKLQQPLNIFDTFVMSVLLYLIKIISSICLTFKNNESKFFALSFIINLIFEMSSRIAI